MRRFVFTALMLFGGLAVPATNAGLWDTVYRGLDILATPSGGPLTFGSDGTAFNGQRNGRLGIQPNILGRGHELQFNRVFGPDSRGRPETFDFGPVDLTLDGSTAMTANYTRRGFLIAGADLNVGNLNYDLTAKTGAQDVQYTGTLNAQNAIEVNQFGFYELTINVSNTNSELKVDGVVANNTEETNFDIGPIVVKGNIFADAVGGLLDVIGVDTSAFDGLFAKSPIDQITDSVEASLASGNLLDDTATAKLNQALIGAAIFGAADGNQLADLLAQAAQGADLSSAGATVSGSGAAAAASGSQGTLVPEPGAILLLVAGAFGVGAFRRRLG